MNLKKRNYFTPKKEGIFLMSMFLSSTFSFQTRSDLVLVNFCYNAAVRGFLKTFRKFAGNRLLWKRFYQSLSYLKWTQVSSSFYQFSKHLFVVPSKHSRETHDNIVWCKYSRVVKYLTKNESFFLLTLLVPIPDKVKKLS